MTKFGLQAATIDKIRGVFARFTNIERAVLYGSRAKGNFKPGSDIDLTLFGEELDAEQLGDIAEAQHLESIYQRKLTALDELKKSLLHQAFSGEL